MVTPRSTGRTVSERGPSSRQYIYRQSRFSHVSGPHRRWKPETSLARHSRGQTRRVESIRLNAVILKGKNDHEVMDLVRFVEQQPKHLQLRFIEYMPFEVRRFEPVPSSTILAQIAQERTLMAIDKAAPTAGPAKEWFAPETNLHVGFITPLSQQFCATCNRLRMTATGHLRTCLAHEDTPSLRDLLRGGASDEELARNIRNMVMGKPEGHACTVEGGQPFEGIMTGIGG